MKKFIVSASVILSIAGCVKKNVTPVNSTNVTSTTTNNPYTNMRQNGGQPGDHMRADLTSGPNDPACVPGQAYCIEVIVKPNFYNAVYKVATSGDIQGGLTDDVIATLSDGDDNIQKILKKVKQGNKDLMLIDMPNAAGTKYGLIMGNKNHLSISNYDAVVVLNNREK